MKRILVVIATALTSIVCATAEEFSVPSHGNWQGAPIGTWRTVRITSHNSKNSPSESVRIWKRLLLGEDRTKNTITVWGQADASGTYVKENPTTVSGVWSENNPVPVPDEIQTGILKVGDQDIPVIIKTFGPDPDRWSRVINKEMIWELKSRPGFVLKRVREQRDRFKDETYEYVISERVIGSSRTNVLGKIVRCFHIEQEETVDGRVTSRAKFLRSDALPEQGLIYGLQTWCDEEGKETRSSQTELVGYGCAPEEAEMHKARMQSLEFRNEHVPLESEAGKVNVAHLKRQGIAEEVAREIVATRISVKDLEYGRTRALKIDAEWKRYQAEPTDDNRTKLLGQCQHIGSNSVGYIEPRLERVLLEISHTDDVELRIAALASLVGYVPVLYAPMLEETLIREKQYTNESALRVLSSARWGNPRQVLSRNGVDLSTLSIRLIPDAPDERAVSELMRRFQEGDAFRKAEVLEFLGYYSYPEVKALISRLAHEITQDDFQWGATDDSYLLLRLMIVMADLNIEGASELFLKWMEWNAAVDGDTAEDPEAVMRMRAIMGTSLITHGSRLRNERVDARIATLLESGSVNLSAFMNDKSLDQLGEVTLELTPDKMELLLSKPLSSVFFGREIKGEQLYGLLRLFKFSATDENFDYVMSKLMPDWTADTDYSELALAENKWWYARRKGIEPLNVDKMHPEILCDLLPSFGDKGEQVLIQLCGHPGFRRYAVPALIKTTHRQTEARDCLSAIRPGLDDNEFRLDLALWCLGDGSKREDCEKYLYFPPSDARAGTVRVAVGYLPFDTVYPLLKQFQSANPDKHFGIWAGTALGHHKNRKSAELIMALWEGEDTSRRNPEYGELFNRMAGRNFGMDQHEIVKWIQTLPAE